MKSMKSMSVLISVVSRRKQACKFHQPFCFVSLFNRFIIEKALSQNTNTGSTSPMQSLLSVGNCPVAPRWLRAWLPFKFFKIASLEVSWYSRMFFPVWCCNAALNNKISVGTDISCNLTRHYGLPLLFTKEYLFSQLELNFLFSSDTSLLTLGFC